MGGWEAEGDLRVRVAGPTKFMVNAVGDVGRSSCETSSNTRLVPPCVPFMRHELFELPCLFLFGYASKSSEVK